MRILVPSSALPLGIDHESPPPLIISLLLQYTDVVTDLDVIMTILPSVSLCGSTILMWSLTYIDQENPPPISISLW